MQNEFNQLNYQQIENPWQYKISNYPIKPINDTIQIACMLYKKWNVFGDTGC